MLELRRLRALREVARHGSFSGAADSLNFTPSAISQQIAQLERGVGVQLVERRSTGVVLTTAGEVLLAHANAMLARAADAEAELRELAAGNWGRLRVAAFASAAAALMPDTIVAFRNAQPRVAIELVEEDRAEALEELQCGDLDLAIVVTSGHQSEVEDLEFLPLLDDYIDVLIPASHRLAGLPALSLEDLRDEPWVDCSGGPVAFWLSQRGIDPHIVFRSDHHYVVTGLVAAEVAIAFSPRLTQPVGHPDVVVKPIAPDPPIRRVGIAVRAGQRSPAVAALIDILELVAATRIGYLEAGVGELTGLAD